MVEILLSLHATTSQWYTLLVTYPTVRVWVKAEPAAYASLQSQNTVSAYWNFTAIQVGDTALWLCRAVRWWLLHIILIAPRGPAAVQHTLYKWSKFGPGKHWNVVDHGN